MAEPAVVDTYPLTPLQQGMLFHHLEGSHPGVDIEQMVAELREPVDVALLEDVWLGVAARHAAFRTRFRWAGLDVPHQEVLSDVVVSLTRQNLRTVAADARDVAIRAFIDADRRAEFDLASAPLWRMALLEFDDSHFVFVFTYHHAILDASALWTVEEAFETYDAHREMRPYEPIDRADFGDHVRWLTEHNVANREPAMAYFARLLAGADTPTRLQGLDATEVPEPDQGSHQTVRSVLTETLSESIRNFCEANHLSAPTVIEVAWGLVLSSFSGSLDVVFGVTRSGRRSRPSPPGPAVGLFSNTPPVRLTINPSESVLELMMAIRQQQLERRPHEHAPLTDIQAAARTHGAALFDTAVVINGPHLDTQLHDLGPRYEHRRFDFHDQTNFGLTLLVYLDPAIRIKLSFDRRRFDESRMGRVHDLFVQILEGMMANPNAPVRELPRVPQSDIDLLQRWNDTSSPYESGTTVHELFESQVDRTPDAVAVIFRDEQLTYRELDGRANALAAHLGRLGVGRNSMVGILVDRSVEMMVGLLGILKAGGAYVPMDPGYPLVRLEMMLEDAHAEVVIAHAHLADIVPTSVAHVVTIDHLGSSIADRGTARGSGGDDLAYVIFTSGSTGRPKGVMVEHRNVANFLMAMDDVLQFDPTDPPGTWLAVTSISFDISVLELFWTLTRGFTLIVQEDELRSVEPRPTDGHKKAMEFSLFYFAAGTVELGRDRYRLMLEGAKFADERGFAAVWTPERHFHDFGGLYPNAAITSAAIAMVTERIAIRAGSVVLPLHNPVRCAEDWSVVDNLSNGRVGLSFASGWHANDFVLAPDNFVRRRSLMVDGIETVRSLWRGDSVSYENGEGQQVDVRMYPPPVQPIPDIWITSGGTTDTFILAGTIGANVLTNLLVMSEPELVANVAAYRAAFRAAGHAGNGHVTLMLHTYVGSDEEDIRATVREPFIDYLRTSTDLIDQVRWERTGFAKGDAQDPRATAEQRLGELTDDEVDVIMDHAFERYFSTSGLFGSVESCMATVERFAGCGVDEIACLVDFIPDTDLVLGALNNLDNLRAKTEERATQRIGTMPEPAKRYDLVGQLVQHRVTHFQCTPSLANVIVTQQGGAEAIGGLRTFLVGGEALPPSLAQALVPLIRGNVINMYGPTETTIWSTAAPISATTEPITIGRPIANTQVYVVDPELQALPIGVAGELLIGGAGVVRGYLDRAELTHDRFVHLPGVPGRAYRTGDLVRILPSGEIEFSGRLDHQVKIRGFRIELGEIEAAISRHPAVTETVVVARTDAPGDPRLTAYVVHRPEDTSISGGRWASVWNETYTFGDGDANFDISGWNSSYTGQPIESSDMMEWVDVTTARILDLEPRRVLEIGCGTGLLLYRVAPHVERYLAVDVAQAALDRIASELDHSPIPGVTLLRGSADMIASLTDERFDTVVINSVVQYFPSAEYLVDVIRQALSLLSPGGRIFIGDVRSLRHRELFAADIELFRADEAATTGEIRHRMRHRIDNDEELVIDSEFFAALQRSIDGIQSVRIRVKAGRSTNELTRFRYDVVVNSRTEGDATPYGNAVTLTKPSGMQAIADALALRPETLIVTGLRNVRLTDPTHALRRLSDPDHPTPQGIANEHSAEDEGVHPDDLALLHSDYETDVMWSVDGPDRIDALFRSRTASVLPSPSRPLGSAPHVGGPIDWTDYTNKPASHVDGEIAVELRAALRASLPDFMVPSAFVVLEALPRTPNGKIDRNALPAPDRERSEELRAVAPIGDIEASIATVWKEMLALDTVGVETNLFDLGANSLMMVQASGRISAALGRTVRLVEMFRFPTVRALASHLDLDAAQDSGELHDSQGRAQTRLDAMQRRRDARRR